MLNLREPWHQITRTAFYTLLIKHFNVWTMYNIHSNKGKFKAYKFTYLWFFLLGNWRTRAGGGHTGVFILAIYLPVNGSVNFRWGPGQKDEPEIGWKWRRKTKLKAKHTTTHPFSHESRTPHPIASPTSKIFTNNLKLMFAFIVIFNSKRILLRIWSIA